MDASPLTLELEAAADAEGEAELRDDGLHVELPAARRRGGGAEDFCGLEFRAQPANEDGDGEASEGGSDGGHTLKVVRRVLPGSIAASLGVLGPGMVLRSVQAFPLRP